MRRGKPEPASRIPGQDSGDPSPGARASRPAT